MSKHNVIAIDLAKSTFQVSVVNSELKEILNKSFSRAKFTAWIVKQKPSQVAMEACSSAHHWARTLTKMGHLVTILPAHSVTPYRQGHKTDKNDALAIAIAARQPNIHHVAMKSIDQQCLQSIERIRAHWTDQITSTSNMIRSLLAEFGIAIPRGVAALHRHIPDILEDANNELPIPMREQLYDTYQLLLKHQAELDSVTQKLNVLISQQDACIKLTKLEGIGPVNALALYLMLGDNGGSFKNGRQASACAGVTPVQHSTGGKTNLGSIRKTGVNKRIRANLIQGAMSVVRQLGIRPPKNLKEKWLADLIDRRRKRCAAVALVNKNIRTAWALLSHQQDYKQPQILTV